MDMHGERYDAIVVGGGAAGLSAGVTFARAKRSVLVLDAGAPRNAPADGVHGLLGREGIAPAELLRRGRDELAGYGGELRPTEVTAVRREGEDLVALTADGEFRGRRLLLATGLVDVLPEIPGVRERWGHEVIHCPYCHGWEVRDSPIGVIATTPLSAHQGLLFRQWTDDLLYFANDVPLTAEDRERLEAIGVGIVEGRVESVQEGAGSRLSVRMRDGRRIARHALAVGTRMEARVAPFAGLGLTVAPHPGGSFVEADAMGRTAVPGVWVAGNAGDLSAQVGAAAAAGVRAAAAINADLVMQDADAAVARRRTASAA